MIFSKDVERSITVSFIIPEKLANSLLLSNMNFPFLWHDFFFFFSTRFMVYLIRVLTELTDISPRPCWLGGLLASLFSPWNSLHEDGGGALSCGPVIMAESDQR